MTGSAAAKNDRLQVRLDAPSKRKLQRAAGYRHKTVSQFVLASALEAAERTIRENESNLLSAGDWRRFMDALDQPPTPNAALRKAFARYAKDMA
ncbi:MAG: DUF1778 domain-containing protein [Proteobacteria bacterium]|nr:DUF1778 domain-containing protein [Pseudomonadota bacterium]